MKEISNEQKQQIAYSIAQRFYYPETGEKDVFLQNNEDVPSESSVSDVLHWLNSFQFGQEMVENLPAIYSLCLAKFMVASNKSLFELVARCEKDEESNGKEELINRLLMLNAKLEKCGIRSGETTVIIATAIDMAIDSDILDSIDAVIEEMEDNLDEEKE